MKFSNGSRVTLTRQEIINICCSTPLRFHDVVGTQGIIRGFRNDPSSSSVRQCCIEWVDANPGVIDRLDTWYNVEAVEEYSL